MKRLIHILSSFEKFVASVFMGLMTLLVILDVLSRELINQGIPWAQKSAVYLMIWSGFIGAILICEKASHLRPEIAEKFWGEDKKLLFIRVQNFTTMIVSFIFLYYSFLYVRESFSFGDKSVVLQVPLWTLQLIIPYAFLSMSMRHIFFILNPNEQLKIKQELSS